MRLSMTQPSIPSQQFRSILDYLGSEQSHAFGIALFFHLLMTLLLLSQWQQVKLPEPKVKTIKVQMLVQPLQLQPAPEITQLPAVSNEPPPTVNQAVKPVELPSAVTDAKFAKKRVEEVNKAEELNVAEQLKPIEQSDLVSQSIPNLESTNSNEKSEVVKSNNSESDAQSKANSDSTTITSSSNNFDINQYVPITKEAPAYPQRALDKGVQGSCTVKYTVNTQGLAEDAEALSDCHAFFIKPSLEATKTFRYTPRIVDGKAVKVPNVKNTFQYRIE